MKIAFAYDGYEHLGIGYLTAVARRDGHTVDLVPLPLGDYIRGPKKPTARGVSTAVAGLSALRPDVVAFSLNSFMAGAYGQVAAALRKRGIRTIAGGPHATAEPLTTIGSGAFDAVVTHEAESVFIEALDAVTGRRASSPPWLFTEDRRDASPPPTPDINAVPFPDKELMYRNAPFEARHYKIVTSRGCPYRCIFCAHSRETREPRFRRRSVENVMEELLQAKRLYRPSTIYFLDDVFTVQFDWLRAFLREYRQRVQLPFSVISHPKTFNERIAALLREAGCFSVRLGVQSLTPAVQAFLGRPESADEVGHAIDAAKRERMRVEIDHMVNLPGETLDEARHAVALYNQWRPNAIKVYWLLPLPGTEWFDRARRDGRISAESVMRIRRGTGFGTHSYLYHSGKEYSDSRWLGIHALLAYLPYLPRAVVRTLLRAKADRVLRIRSFVFLVGIPRLIGLLASRDTVGATHVRRILSALTRWSRIRKKGDIHESAVL